MDLLFRFWEAGGHLPSLQCVQALRGFASASSCQKRTMWCGFTAAPPIMPPSMQLWRPCYDGLKGFEALLLDSLGARARPSALHAPLQRSMAMMKPAAKALIHVQREISEQDLLPLLSPLLHPCLLLHVPLSKGVCWCLMVVALKFVSALCLLHCSLPGL